MIESFLSRCFELKASDLHINTDWYPIYRVHGSLRADGESKLSYEQVRSILDSVTNDTQKAIFEAQGGLDFGYTSTHSGERFRVNAYREMGRIAFAIRHLNNEFKTLSELKLPQQMEEISKLKKGLVLVTGATGSGKSTTLATMLNEINLQRDDHIITIEDPIEFVHQNKASLVHQRELHSDVPDFASAVRASLREDPDVLMVGEMRDLETIRAALTAAETGHLVFSTLHTSDAVGVVERLVGSFPGNEQTVARNRISMCLKAVIAQQLVPTIDGQGRVPAIEILRVTPAVANLIDSGKTRQIYSMMESGRSEGMQTLDQSLVELVKEKWIQPNIARSLSRNTESFEKLMQMAGLRGLV
jgi:twitching motility protein PilT